MQRPASKQGPRAKRIQERDVLGAVEQELEKKLRDERKPQGIANARQAKSTMSRQEWK